LVGKHKARLKNATSGSVLLVGSSEYNTNSASCSTSSRIRGQFTVAASQLLQVEHYTQLASATTGLGASTGSGDVENYTVVELWQVLAGTQTIPGGTWVLIGEQSLSVAGTTITFSSIPQIYRHLKVYWRGQIASGENAQVSVWFNGDTTAANYEGAYVQGNDAATPAAGAAGVNSMAGSATASNSWPSQNELTIDYYCQSGLTYRTGVCAVYSRNTAGNNISRHGAFVWHNSAAITSLTFVAPSNMNAGAIFSLYAIA
jgi:hypothetical protein